MKSTDASSSLFKRHAIFPLIFTFLFLALLASSVAVVRQQQIYRSHAVGGAGACPSSQGGKGEACCIKGTIPNTDRQCRNDGDHCVNGRCVGKNGANCSKPSQCGPGLTCYQGKCSDLGGGGNSDGAAAGKDSGSGGVKSCNEGCPDGKACKPSGFCLGSSQCWTQADCAAGTLCNANDGVGDCVPDGKSSGGSGGGGTGGGGAAPAPAAPAPAAKAPTAAPAAPTTAAPTATPKPGDVVLDLKLKFQGITKQPKDNEMDIRVSLNSSVTASGRFTADSGGVWSGSVTLTGVDLTKKYSIYVKGPKHLQKRICTASPSESSPGTYTCNTDGITLKAGTNSFNFSNILLLAGDLPDQDGVVDSSDLSFIRQHLGSTDSDDLEVGDVNLDGVINTQDYSLVIAALAIKTDDPVN